MAENINRVTITGNLTRDPELRNTPSGTAVCTLGVAVNGRRKDESGSWVDKPNYFNVVVWGAQGQNCANYLSKGRPVAVDGRLDWRSWEAKDGSGKRSTIEIVADTVQFLGSRDGSAPGGNSGGGNGGQGGGGFAPSSDVPADTGDFAPSGGGGNAPDDDIPF
ncbi:MAG: single-strand DNA-binding protein [Actinomycetota bacterium]|jgi:single-strand DNA-binding protein|nr:single-strand DNA-binding protein [Actinomycetota bacterium]